MRPWRIRRRWMPCTCPPAMAGRALMDDAEVLNWIRQQASGACSIFSVCTGALICGAPGLLKGRRATTHWGVISSAALFRPIPSTRVWWWMAPGSLPRASSRHRRRLAAEPRGDEAAQTLQLHMAYAPKPTFDSGTPETAPSPILDQARRSVRTITVQREQTARHVSAKLGIAVPPPAENEPRRAPILVWRESRVYWRARQRLRP
jgi:cyclohexyl-isocyanide hydratase